MMKLIYPGSAKNQARFEEKNEKKAERDIQNIVRVMVAWINMTEKTGQAGYLKTARMGI